MLDLGFRHASWGHLIISLCSHNNAGVIERDGHRKPNARRYPRCWSGLPVQTGCPQSGGQLVGLALARAGSQSADSVLPSQAGVISGVNPIAFDSSDPLRLWVVQVGVSRRLPLDEFTPTDVWPVVIIILMTQLLSVVLTSRYIRQPRVIAEVIGGVLLGPTVSDLGLALLTSLTDQPIFR